MNQKKTLVLASMIMVGAVGLMSLGGCGGNKQFTKGSYDDPNRVELLDDKFNEADMQQMSQTIVDAMLACDEIAKAKISPVVVVEKVQNRTEEHIDTVSMTDMIRTALIKSKKVRFINKPERGTIEEEIQHNESGAVSAETKKSRGKQIGADYIMSGAIATNVQEVGNDKFIYYKLTMNLTHLETSTIDCTDEREIRKKFRKRTVGM